MSKFLIEVPHGARKVDCARAVQAFLQTGSHFLANADWGCPDEEHKAWLTVDVESRDVARSILPPSLRGDAKIVQLARYTMRDVQRILAEH